MHSTELLFHAILPLNMTLHVQEDGNQSVLSSRAYQSVLQGMNDVGLKFGYYLQQEPDSHLMGLIASADLDRLKSYFKPELLYYRALPNHLPITNLVLAFAQRQLGLTSAAIKAYKPILKFLGKGARPNAKDIAGQTALHSAVMLNPMPPLPELLLKHGADPNMQSRVGATPLLSAVQAPNVSFPSFGLNKVCQMSLCNSRPAAQGRQMLLH